MNEKIESITFDIPLELWQELDTLSKEIGKDKQKMMEEALNMYLAYQELSLQQKPMEDVTNKPLTADEFFDDLDI
ncbi:ribbon-helix-helix domain-containing protein [Sulfurimonas sp. CS5]|jgi:predicted DNA-binding protein|uniref:ribbon-helix-helix domain-containing protein n=1 Tax=Sulfurimonas sp. CS5 TaxID=3391145 RepID=UPI0039EB377F